MGGEEDFARSLATLDRRRFLRLTGLAAAAGVLPTGCNRIGDDLAPPPDLTLSVLSPRNYATFQAASRAILGPAGLRAASGIDLAARADARLAAAPEFASLMKQALLALEFGVHPLVPKWRTYTGLSPDDRVTVLAKLATARLDLSRALFQGVRSFTWLSWYSSVDSHAALRYPGPFGNAEAGIADAMTYDVEPERQPRERS